MFKISGISIVSTLALLLVFTAHTNTAEAYCDSSALGITTYGRTSQTTVTLQNCLIEAGYYIPAGPTGYFGEQTRSAVKQFYTEQLLMPDWQGYSVGPIGRSTLASVAQSPIVYTPPAAKLGYKTVSSADELTKYISAERSDYTTRSSGGLAADSTALAMPSAEAGDMNFDDSLFIQGSTPDRVSDTNVQIAGIDEPDIVKTDGKNIFLSRQSNWYGWRGPVVMTEEIDIAAPYYQPNPTTIIDSYPVEDLAVISEDIEETGEMLLVKEEDILIIFSRPNIVAYDVSDPDDPDKLWEREIDDRTSIVTSRLLNGSVYLVTQTSFNRETPCPVIPMRWGNRSLSIPCTQILVPERIEPVSQLYTALKIDATDGSVDAKTAVAADYGGVTVMMSQDNLYLASRAQSARQEVLTEVLIKSAEPYVPPSVTSRARKIQGYDISGSGKISEIGQVYESYLNGLNSDERLRISNEIENRLSDELSNRVRDMYRSRIVRFDLDTLAVKATGDIPGYLLNQFAMDEHNNNLRAAVTIDDGWGGAESANDVYVLNSQLNVVGQIQDLGLSERIYSVRFMGDTGYLVTFRQIDPFYVLDLSIPASPKMVGELKIPGFSSYLEYLGDDLVLGVGREGSGVKLSIFDVSNPALPVEKSKYQLKDSWTEVQNNHHAFLRDDEHEIFFIPGNQGGYIFSYNNGQLALEKALSGYGIKRALYIDDNLYIISDDKIRVLDEYNWEEVNDLSL